MVRLCLFLLVILFISGCEVENGIEHQKPNVILILADDQGWGDLSAHGNPIVSTPNIDQIAKDGISLTQFFVQPVCSPTRAELFTGRYHVRSGVSGTSLGQERIDLDEYIIAEAFQQEGEKTAAFGKWHSGSQYPYHPNGRGFEHFYGFTSGHWGHYFDPILEENGVLTRGKGYITDDLTDKAIAYLEENKSHPFFVYLPYNVPHSPMQVPDKWWEKYEDADLEFQFENEVAENHAKAALAMVENLDWNVGRINQFLSDNELEENTIVIYLTDNGPNGWRYNGGMRGRKGSTDDGGTRSPFFIKWPQKLQAGIERNNLSSVIDILPTLHSLCGMQVDLPNEIDGVDLSDILLNSESGQKIDERFIINHWRGKTSVRTPKYRLDAQDQLYNILQDPGQLEDISQVQPEVRKELRDIKSEWESNVLIELPAIDDRPYPIGHKDYDLYQLPIRDATAHGNIERSNQYGNDSYFTNWTSVKDSITWDVEVQNPGSFNVSVYYSCAEENVGSSILLKIGNAKIEGKIETAVDQTLIGADEDRVPRIESYVQEFGILEMGEIDLLEKGPQQVILKSEDIAHREVADVRLLALKRVNDKM